MEESFSLFWIPTQAARECTMPRYGEKLNVAVQNLRIKLYVISFDSVQKANGELTYFD